MPKATRQRITPRGQVEVNAGTGTSGVPAAIRTHADSFVTRDKVLAPDRYAGSGFAALSGVFRELAAEAKYQERKAEAEAEKARNKAEREAEKAAAKAEQLAELQELRAARFGLMKDVDETLTALGKGDLNRDSLEEKVRSLDALGEGKSLKTQAFFSENAFKLYERGLGVLRERELSNIGSTAEDIMVDGLNTLGHTKESTTYDEWGPSTDALIDSVTAYGKPRHEVEAEVLDTLIQEAEASGNQKLHDFIVRKFKDGTLTPATMAGRQRMYAFENNFADKVIEKENKSESLSLQKENMRASKAYSTASSIFTSLDSIEKQQAMLAGILANPEAAQAEYGDYYVKFVEGMEQTIDRKLNRVETERQKADKEMMKQMQWEHMQGVKVLTQADVDASGLETDGKLLMTGFLNQSNARKAAITGEIVKDMRNAFLAEVDKKWEGIGKASDAKKIHYARKIEGRIRTLAEETPVDLDNPDSVGAFQDAIAKEGRKSIALAYADELDRSFVEPPDDEEFDSPKKQMARVFSLPDGASAAPGRIPFNRKAWEALSPEDQKRNLPALQAEMPKRVARAYRENPRPPTTSEVRKAAQARDTFMGSGLLDSYAPNTQTLRPSQRGNTELRADFGDDNYQLPPFIDLSDVDLQAQQQREKAREVEHKLSEEDAKKRQKYLQDLFKENNTTFNGRTPFTY